MVYRSMPLVAGISHSKQKSIVLFSLLAVYLFHVGEKIVVDTKIW
jgi:hypothetical protein